jgi:hypothetical protein
LSGLDLKHIEVHVQYCAYQLILIISISPCWDFRVITYINYSCGASSRLLSLMRCSRSAALRNMEFGICEYSQLSRPLTLQAYPDGRWLVQFCKYIRGFILSLDSDWRP